MDKLREYLNAERGRRSRLAEALCVSPSAISMWDQVPSDRLEEVARLTGIAPHVLRPDLARIFATAEHGAAA